MLLHQIICLFFTLYLKPLITIIIPDEEAIISAAQAGKFNAINELIQMHENKQIGDDYILRVFDRLNIDVQNRAFLINIVGNGNVHY